MIRVKSPQDFWAGILFVLAGGAALSDDSNATAARLQGDIAKWGPLVKAAKIEPQ